ncbi:hypothetical protein ACSBR2_040092 [Camellia fascicularis]
MSLTKPGEQNETNTIEGENIGDAVDHFLKTRVSLSLSRILHGRLLCNGNRAYPLHCGWILTARDDNPCRHRRLEKLYFLTASRVLFSNPPHISKFWTFPVVQLFLTCIPSLAIYVMGKYASYEFKRMKAAAMQEIEYELKKMPSVTKTNNEEEHKKRLHLSDAGSNTKNATGNNPTRLKLEEPALNSVIEAAKQKPEVNASNGGIS